MRAVFFSTGFDGGGAERHFARLVPGLVPSAEYRIALSIAPFSNDQAPRDLECDGLGFRSGYDYPAVIRRLVRILDERRIDLIYSISRCPNVVASAAAVIAKRRPVVVLGENTRPLEAFRFSRRLRDAGWLALQSGCFRAADMVICNSEAACREVVSHFGADPAKVRLARNPLPAKPVWPAKKVAVPEAGPCDVVTASRLVPGKGLEDLIDAWAGMKIHSGRLVVLGDGPLLGKLRDRAMRAGVDVTVSFPGWVDDPTPWLEKAALVVLASYWEGLPNLVLEAMASGVPVLATRSTSWIVDFEKAGAVEAVAVGDVAGLAAGIASFLASKEKQRRLGAKGREIAADFQLEDVVKERSLLLEEAWAIAEDRESRA